MKKTWRPPTSMISNNTTITKDRSFNEAMNRSTERSALYIRIAEDLPQKNNSIDGLDQTLDGDEEESGGG